MFMKSFWSKSRHQLWTREHNDLVLEMGMEMGTNQKIQVHTWSVASGLARAKCCGVHSQALKDDPSLVSLRKRIGRSPLREVGWNCEILEPKDVTWISMLQNHMVADFATNDWQSFQQFKGSKKTNQFWCSLAPSSCNWLTNLPIYHPKISDSSPSLYSITELRIPSYSLPYNQGPKVTSWGAEKSWEEH